jgi:hypothetical protein
MMSIAEHIRARKSTYRKLAAEISERRPFGRSISVGQLNNIANGTKGSDLDTLLAIKEVTGLSIDVIAEARRKKLLAESDEDDSADVDPGDAT